MLAVEMPKWGMTMEEGLVADWLVAEGEAVRADQPVVEVESSKIAGEVTAASAGVLVRIVARAGQELPVGALLGVIADAGEGAVQVDAFVAAHGAASGPTAGAGEGAGAARAVAPGASPEPPAPAEPVAASESPGPAGSGAALIPAALRGADAKDAPATPYAAELAAEHGIALERVRATGRGGRVTVADLRRAVEEAGGRLPFGNERERTPVVFSRRDDSRVPATPHARSLAEERGVNLNDARPTGTHGRVTVADVELVLARRAAAGGALVPALAAGAREVGAPAAAPAAEVRAAGERAAGPERADAVTEVPVSRMRAVIGARLRDSYLDSPHFRVSVHARIDDLLALRRQINEGRRDLRISVNDLVVAAAARALVAVPEVNVHYDERARVIRRFAHADVSVAVATREGLITPIVTRADTRTVADISATVHDLATRAKAGTLKPDEFQGGTFTVSNLGMFGVSGFDAIINPPQAAILAVGAASRQFVPDEDDRPVAATLLPLTLSADHRVIDGALAARFCAELRRLLQSPALIFV